MRATRRTAVTRLLAFWSLACRSTAGDADPSPDPRDNYAGFRIREGFKCAEVTYAGDTPEARAVLEGFVQRMEPVVLRGAARDFAPNWTFESLKTAIGDTMANIATSKVKVGESLGEHEGRKARVRMPFREFVEEIEGGRSSKYLGLQGKREWHEGLMANVQHEIKYPPIFDDLLGLGREYEQTDYEASLWMGVIGEHETKSGLHCDRKHNLYVLLSGRKRFTLASPESALHLERAHGIEKLTKKGNSVPRRGVNTGGPLHKTDADPDLPDYQEFPGLHNIHFGQCELNAGDVLYLPHNFMHQVLSSGKVLALNFWLVDPQRGRQSDEL